jgi:hypothetical protein
VALELSLPFPGTSSCIKGDGADCRACNNILFVGSPRLTGMAGETHLEEGDCQSLPKVAQQNPGCTVESCSFYAIAWTSVSLSEKWKWNKLI